MRLRQSTASNIPRLGSGVRECKEILRACGPCQGWTVIGNQVRSPGIKNGICGLLELRKCSKRSCLEEGRMAFKVIVLLAEYIGAGVFIQLVRVS